MISDGTDFRSSGVRPLILLIFINENLIEVDFNFAGTISARHHEGTRRENVFSKRKSIEPITSLSRFQHQLGNLPIVLVAWFEKVIFSCKGIHILQRQLQNVHVNSALWIQINIILSEIHIRDYVFAEAETVFRLLVVVVFRNPPLKHCLRKHARMESLTLRATLSEHYQLGSFRSTSLWSLKSNKRWVKRKKILTKY